MTHHRGFQGGLTADISRGNTNTHGGSSQADEIIGDRIRKDLEATLIEKTSDIKSL